MLLATASGTGGCCHVRSSVLLAPARGSLLLLSRIASDPDAARRSQVEKRTTSRSGRNGLPSSGHAQLNYAVGILRPSAGAPVTTEKRCLDRPPVAHAILLSDALSDAVQREHV
jgi:hypothetical protein